jgi:hypothetical protein
VAAREGKKMADAKSLAKAMENLTMFLISKEDGSTLGDIVFQGEVVQKLVLLLTNLKIEENIGCGAKGSVDGHFLGTIGEPGDKTSAEGKKWNTINSLLIGVT